MTHPLQQALNRLRSVDRSALPPATSRLISMVITDLRLFICVGGGMPSEYVNAAEIVASDRPHQVVRKLDAAAAQVCRFPGCECPMDPGPEPDWCARGLPHAAGVQATRPSDALRETKP